MTIDISGNKIPTGDGILSKDELRRFYNVFMEMDFVGLVSRLTDVAYTRMTGVIINQ